VETRQTGVSCTFHTRPAPSWMRRVNHTMKCCWCAVPGSIWYNTLRKPLLQRFMPLPGASWRA